MFCFFKALFKRLQGVQKMIYSLKYLNKKYQFRKTTFLGVTNKIEKKKI